MTNTLSDKESVTFTSLDKTAEGKIDTGASVSSLNATNIKLGRGQVSFVCPQLSPNSLTVPLIDTQDVSSADGGTSSRPVVEFDIEIAGVSLYKQQFNLNDRSDMDSPILIGQNIIEAGKFIININQPSAVDSDSGQTAPTEQSTSTRDQQIASAMEQLINLGCSLNEMVSHLATVAAKRIK